MASSLDNKKSRYVQGGTTETFDQRLGWWERNLLKRDSSDVSVFIDARYDQHPELVAFDYLGSVNYVWLVLQYNNIVDISTEFVSGVEIKLPSLSRLSTDLLNSNTKK